MPHPHHRHAQGVSDGVIMMFACRVFFQWTIALAALSSVALSQNPIDPPAVPTVTFNVFWEASTPQEYTIRVTSLGSARYLSRNPTQPPDANGMRDEDYVTEFAMSAPPTQHISDLVVKANFSDGKLSYTQRAVA